MTFERISRTDVLSKGLHTFEIVYVDYNGRRIGHYVTDPMSYERAKAHLVSLIKRSMARDKLVAGGYLVAADLGAGSEGRGRIR